MENIRIGRKDATDEELVHVCKLAQADDFISQFPDGYDTYIEQGGTNVSGGQKQRLCIARRRAAEDIHSPGVPQGRAHHPARRGHCQPGRRERNADTERAVAAHKEQDRSGDSPPDAHRGRG